MTDTEIALQHAGHDLVAARSELRRFKENLREEVQDIKDMLELDWLDAAGRRLDRIERMCK